METSPFTNNSVNNSSSLVDSEAVECNKAVEVISEPLGSIGGRESKKITFSVIICAHSCERYIDTIDAVDSVLKQTGADDEVILVVDRNEKLYKKLFSKLSEDTSVTVLFNNQYAGLSGSRNIGLTKASGEIVAFLDDDAVADVNWLVNLQGVYADRGIIGCGGPIRPLWIAGEAKWIPEEFYWVMGCTYKGFKNQKRRVRSNFGSNMSFRRFVLADEMFDTNLGIRDDKGVGEEVELSIRLLERYSAHYICHCPEAIVFHKIFNFRKSAKHLFNRCYQYGEHIGYFSKDSNSDLGDVYQDDKNMMTYLVFDSIPDRIISLFGEKKRPRGLVTELIQIILIFLSSLTIISGLLAGRLKRTFRVVHS